MFWVIKRTVSLRLIEMVLLSIHNICFGLELRKLFSALDKLLGQLGIYATWLSSIAYLQKQLRIVFLLKNLRHVFGSDYIRFLIE